MPQKAFFFLLVLVLLATVPMWLFHNDYSRYRAHQHANCAPRAVVVGGESAGRSGVGGDGQHGGGERGEHAFDGGDAGDGATTPSSGAATTAAVDGERFTVLLNTFKRRDLLKLAVAHYATCPEVAQIRVVWSEQTPPPSPRDPDGGDYFGPKPSMVVYDTHPTTSIQNRFEPPPNNPSGGGGDGGGGGGGYARACRFGPVVVSASSGDEGAISCAAPARRPGWTDVAVGWRGAACDAAGAGGFRLVGGQPARYRYHTLD